MGRLFIVAVVITGILLGQLAYIQMLRSTAQARVYVDLASGRSVHVWDPADRPVAVVVADWLDMRVCDAQALEGAKDGG